MQPTLRISATIFAKSPRSILVSSVFFTYRRSSLPMNSGWMKLLTSLNCSLMAAFTEL